MSFATDTTSRKSRRHPRLHRAARIAAHLTVEVLEGRQLLAAVAAGEIGVYEGANGPVRISVSGTTDANFDFIGATLDNGSPRLNDIPMTIFDSQGNVVREILGGYGGRDGIKPVDVIAGNPNTTNGLMRGNVDPYTSVPNGRVNFDGLASNVRGREFGVNIFQNGPGSSSADINSVDTATGRVTFIEDVSQKMLAALRAVNPAFEDGALLSVIGADFDPGDENTLYFAANVNFPFVTNPGPNATITLKSEPAMFKYDINTHNVTLDPGFFGVSNDTDIVTIQDFSFLDDGTIAIFGSVQFGTDPAQEGLFFSQADNVFPSQFQPVFTGPADNRTFITSVAAIEYIPGENTIIAVTDQTKSARLIGINVNTGRYVDYGPAVNVNDKRDTVLGQTIGDLDWNKRLVDNYFQPGKRGVLLGTDTFFDQLVGIDSRERFQTPDLYAIYGDNVDDDTSVSVSPFTLNSNTNLSFDQQLFTGELAPYDGSAGSIRVINNTLLSLGGGALYLGIRTPDQNDALTVPVLGLDPKTQLAGNRPGVTFPKIVRPGVYVKGTINDFLFAGTITGSVNIDGSIDTFYAANVITGDASGGNVNSTDNFFVNGDLRNLVVAGSVGTISGAPDIYIPKTDFLVNGRIQMLKTGGDFRGSADIAGKTSELTIGSSINELETTLDTRVPNRAGRAFAGILYGGGNLAGPGLDANTASTLDFGVDSGLTNNDTFNTPEVLGAFFSKERNVGGQVNVTGSINNGPNFGDGQDYYGVPLLAGQTIQLQLTPTDGTPDSIYVQVVDPDGRVYASDLSNQNPESFLNQRFSVTANTPGLWRVVVRAFPGLTGGTAVAVDLFRPYLLTIDKVGETSLGGLVAGGEVFLNRSDVGINVRTGDLGAIFATGRVEATVGVNTTRIVRELSFTNAFIAVTGSIRSIEGASISRFENGVYGNFPNIKAPKGSVGLIRANAASAADAFIYFNDTGLNTFTGRPQKDLTIGGDYQVIQTIGDFSAVLSANRGISVIRVGSVAQNIEDLPGYFEVNADNTGSDGYIGLIDCVGDFGTFTYGGPAIYEGQGSNIRYLRVGGIVYRDRFFGVGATSVLTGTNKSVNIRDDSGATVTITPYEGTRTTTNVTPGSGGTPTGGTGIPDPFGGNGDPTQGNNGIPDPFGGNGDPSQGTNLPDPFNGANNPGGGTSSTITTDVIVGTLSVSSYAVRSGGSIIYDVVSTTGVKVNVSKKGGGGSGDITTLSTTATDTGTGNNTGTTTGLGVPVVDPATAIQEATVAPSQLPSLQLGTGTTLDFIFSGGRVNVFDIGGVSPLAGGLQFSRIFNYTDGEIVNLNATSVGYLSAQYLGVARPAGNVQVEGLNSVTDARFPALSNYPFNNPKNMILLTTAIDIESRGPIGNIAVQTVVQNVIANSDNVNDKSVFEGIVAPILLGGVVQGDFSGNARAIDIGEGIANAGTGDVGFAGIYANGELGPITNRNGGGDIRGDIVAGIYMESIHLTGGSILDADIYGVLSAANTTTNTNGISGFGIANEDFRLGLDVIANPIDLTIVDGIGSITVDGNGGIINSRFVGYNIGKVTVANTGFGVFTSEFSTTSGGTLAGLTAGGLGIRGTTYQGGSFVGNVVSNGTGKLHSITEYAKSVRGSESSYFDAATGITPNAANDLDLYLGTNKKLTKIKGVTDDGIIEDSIIAANREVKSVQAYEIRTVKNPFGARPEDETYPTQINFGDKIGKIVAARNLNGVRVVGGTIGTVQAGRDILQFQLQSNSDVGTISAGQNIQGSTHININGTGSLGTLKVGKNINGTLAVATGIGTIDVGGNFAPDSDRGGITTGGNINVLRVGGNVASNAFVRATRAIKLLDIGGDVQTDSIIRAKSISKQTIDGVVYGDIIIG